MNHISMQAIAAASVAATLYRDIPITAVFDF